MILVLDYIIQKIMKDVEYQFWFDNIESIGLKRKKILMDKFANAKNIYHAKGHEFNGLESISEKEIEKIYLSKDIDIIKKNYDILIKKGISFITIENKEYPQKLRNIFDPPYALYYKGKIPQDNEKTIAVIGARECSQYGIEVAKFISSEISKAGISIISGLARGIDCIAHKSAISTGGITYGILGCGVDICYPRENFSTYMDMQKKGGVISEYKPNTQPHAYNFPMRNRIISGLSDGILVIEARKKSGTLITVDMGLEQGKEIYIIPGRITDSLSEGCNNLIKLGAKLVNTAEDILEDFSVNRLENSQDYKKDINKLETKEKIVYACLGLTPKHIDEIILDTKLDIAKIFEILLILELKDFISQPIKNYYIIKLS